MQARKPTGVLSTAEHAYFCVRCKKVFGEYEVHECQR
jgi:rRNA maturation endonuclease Nob1